jgi:hypothetical protein
VKPLAALALLLPALALAQDAAPTLQEDPRAAKFKDVERGVFVGFEAGYQGWLDTPTAEPESFPLAGESGGYGSGLVVGLVVGVDIGSRLSLSLFGQGGNVKASANYGAFDLYAGGADVKVAVLGWRDRNDWERTFLYVHARGGYAKSNPEGLFGTDDFVVALTGDVVHATTAGATGFTIYPSVRYTF